MTRRKLIVLGLFMLGSISMFAQQPIMTISVADPLPSLPFGSFVIGNNLPKTTTVVFSVNISGVQPPPVGPAGFMQVYGEFSWEDIGSSSAELMASFVTKGIPLNTSFTNLDLGDRIRIKDQNTVNGVIQRNLDKGKPTGRYFLRLKLIRSNHINGQYGLGEAQGMSENWNPVTNPDFLCVANLDKPIELANPSQTLSITSPQMNSIQDEGTVLVEWTPIQGVTHYTIRANYKQYALQSMEDALRGNDPLVADVNVGNVTTINLKSISSRNIEPGKFIVIQVTGLVQGTNEKFLSQPICVLIRPQLSAQQQAIISNLQTTLSTGLGSLPPDFLNQLTNGTVVISSIVGENGQTLTEQQVQQIWTYLQQNPQAIVSIKLVLP